MSAVSTEERELRLVDSVDFKILAVANKEEKLQLLLSRYLVPLLLKAASDHASVREKVVTICQRLKIFIQPAEIVLPVAALVDQYKATLSPVTRYLDMTFIMHSLPRLSHEDRQRLVPQVIKGIAKDGDSVPASNMFNVLLALLPDLKLPLGDSQIDTDFAEAMRLSDAQDTAFVAKWLGKTLLVKMPSGPNTPVTTIQGLCVGLSIKDIEFLKLDKSDGQRVFGRVAELKLQAINFLASAAFTDRDKFIPALYSSAIPDSRISQVGEDLLKRTKVSLEDESLVCSLFEEHFILPTPHRTRILSLLAKSTVATTMSEKILALVSANLSSALQLDAPHIPAPASLLERAKLLRALFKFLKHASASHSGEGRFQAGPIINLVRDYIVTQGWPVPPHLSKDNTELRSTAYDLIGALVPKAPLSHDELIELGSWLFESLSRDPTAEVVVSIDGALSSLAPGRLQEGDSDLIDSLEKLLLAWMELPDNPPAVRSVRHMAVKWANLSLPFSNVNARWIDVLAIGGRRNERNDVVEEGLKGLDPWTHYANTNTKPQYPIWDTLVSYFFFGLVRPSGAKRVSLLGPGSGEMDLDGSEHAPDFSGHRLGTLPIALRFCLNTLLLTALPGFEVGPGWDTKLEAGIRNDVKMKAQLIAYLKTGHDNPIVFFLEACFAGLLRDNPQISEKCLDCLVTLARFAPRTAVGHVAHRTADLLPFVTSNNSNIRSLAARAFGILAAHPENSQGAIDILVNKITAPLAKYEVAVGSELNAVSGSLIAYASLCSRMAYYGRNNAEVNLEPRLLHLLIGKTVHISLRTSVTEALGQMWTARLAVPTPSVAGPALEDDLSLAIKTLATDAKGGNETAIWALGRLGIGVDDGETAITGDLDRSKALSSGPLRSILASLFALYEIRQVDVHFAVGEALTAAIACWDSDNVQLSFDVDSDCPASRNGHRPGWIQFVLDKLFQDCKSSKPSLLKASGIWLFSIVQFCSHLPAVQSRLRESQAAFMRLLSARDDLVQETASRGLSLVYERGDDTLRDQLIKDLVSAFTGSSTRLKVDQDTELFEPGVLATGEGKSVTSYRDIVNLANEVGDQSLVYKFMSLASNAATWSTRSAFGRFGLGNILSGSEIDPKLYPKLYRYRFDPNPNVQRSMNDIWKALVKDSNALIDEHFDAIITDLLRCILGREWRVREASCAAITELLRGRPFEKFEKYYDEIWRSATKVLDDIKGSVREAALRMCFDMSNTLVRQLEASGSSASTRAMMGAAIRFLFSESGMESGVEEVKLFATVTAIKVAKNGGSALRPFIPIMIPYFLGLLSVLEPDRVNFAYQRAGEEGREALDRMRSVMVRQSPISEAIEDCLRNVDAEALALFVPRLQETIRTALGVPSKIGCSRVLVTLFTLHLQSVKSTAAEFLRLMEAQVLDRNDEVSKGYAQATAYIMRAADAARQQAFVDHLVDTYFGEGEDETRRQKVADVVVALAQLSPDQFSNLESILLPFSFVAGNDVNEYARSGFQEVWGMHAGSARTAARFVPEICQLVQRCLDGTRWTLRHTGALAAGRLVQDVAKASDASGQMSEANSRMIWPVLDRSLGLKTFSGKEKVIETFAVFADKARSMWKDDEAMVSQLRQVAIREAKRNNDEYRVHAFKSLWELAKVMPEVDLLTYITDIVKPHLDQLMDPDRMDVDPKEREDSRVKEGLATRAAASGIEAIARGYGRAAMKLDSVVVLARILAVLKRYLVNSRFLATKLRVWPACVEDLMDGATGVPEGVTVERGPEVAEQYLVSLDLGLGSAGTESQRLARAKAAAAVVRAVSRGVFGPRRLPNLSVLVRAGMESERSDDVQKVLKEAMEGLE